PPTSTSDIFPLALHDALPIYRLRGRYRGVDSLAVFPAEVLVELYGTLGDARDVLAIVALLTQGLVVAAVMLAVLAGQSQRRGPRSEEHTSELQSLTNLACRLL